MQARDIVGLRPIERAQALVDLVDHELMGLEDLEGVFMQDSGGALDPEHGGASDIMPVLQSGEAEECERQQDRDDEQGHGRARGAKADAFAPRDATRHGAARWHRQRLDQRWRHADDYSSISMSQKWRIRPEATRS